MSVSGDVATAPSIWDEVVGQQRAIERLRATADDPVHAYLFVGPPGSTKDAAARAFAALLLSGGEDPAARDARLALAGEHPDVREVRRVGAALSAEQIDDIIRAASLAPLEGDRKVLVLDEFHLLAAQGAARLLKTLEEPPPSTHFVVLADHLTPELTTIASRCVRIEFSPISAPVIAARLVAEGCAPSIADAAAAASAGSLDRGRVLVSDAGLARRRQAFTEVPSRLDGTGSAVATLVEEITRLTDDAAASLTSLHAAELATLVERVSATGERGSGRKTLEERHKREIRRYRTDELRSALAVIAGVYRDQLVQGASRRPDVTARAVLRVHEALEAFERNPNEVLLLHSLLLDLPSLDLPAVSSADGTAAGPAITSSAAPR